MKRPGTATRRRGVGSITSYTIKAGTRWRWQLHVPVNAEHPEDGMRLAGKGGYTSMEAADNAMQDARAMVRSQLTLRRGGPPTVGEYAERWLDGLRLANSTMDGYRRIMRVHVAPYLGSIKLDQLTATRLARHYRELLEHGHKGQRDVGAALSANTVNKVHVAIGAMLDGAIDDGHIATNPARKARTVKAPTGKQIRAEQPEVATWTASELRAFLEWNRDVFEDYYYTLWLTLANTGMRRGEAIALRWSDIALDTSRISIRRASDVTLKNSTKTTKTGAARVVDIDPVTVAALRAWKAERGAMALDLARPASYVFGTIDNQVPNANAISNRWQLRRAAARVALGPDNLKHLSLKGLRHTHATLLLELGVHPKIVQERLGHSNISTTMNIYSHVTPTMQRDAVDRLAALLTGH